MSQQQQPIFKDHQKRQNAGIPGFVEFSGGQPRYAPPQRLYNGPHQRQSIYQKPATLRSFEGTQNETESLAKVPQVNIKASMLPIQTRHETNPFIQQAPIRHSFFGSAQVDMNAPVPRARKIPIAPKYDQQMNDMRRQEQRIPQGDTKPQYGFLRSKNAQLRVKTNNIGRSQPISQDSALKAHHKFVQQPSVQHAPQRSIRWRAPAYKIQPSMVPQQVKQARDYRLEKRKEQQQAYQTRNDQEKQRMEGLYKKIAHIKNAQNRN